MSKVPANGSVIRYPYLWAWQRNKGETEGRKSRPVCMVLSIPQGRGTILVLLAISGTTPTEGQTALEIPELEARRAGLRDWKRGWITVSEYNLDLADRSYYLEPDGEVLGTFSRGFLSRIAASLKPFLLQSSAKVERF